MANLRVHRALLGVPGLSYRGKALGLAAAAVAIQLASGVLLAVAPGTFGAGSARFVLVGAATLASLLLLTTLAGLLSAVGAAARRLEDCVQLASGTRPDDANSRDEIARMMGDVSAVAERLESVRHRLANRHPVTGAPTREPLFEAIDRDIASGPATGMLGVVRLAQFDRLAAVDKPGAERLLQAFYERLSTTVDGQRPLAQVDRDCFAVWFRDAGGPKGAAAALRALSATLGEPMVNGDSAVAPDVRVGAAIYPNDGDTAPTLLSRAVGALAKSSRMSAGKLAFFSDESSAAAEARFSMEQALRQAMSRHELSLFYQPVIDMTASRVVGAEALLRWRHPQVGSIPPAQFLPVLEQSGMIDEVGRWVLDVACRDARAFEQLALPGFRVGVNLSERQFRDASLASTIADALRRYELKAGRLELELTESSLMEDLAHTRKTFDALSDLGVNVAIDDFGAGASSLGDLKSLTFSKLKIDRAFVTDVAERHDSQAICAALIELGRRLDIAVLAEGVETREEVDALRVLGCSLFQGFFFSRPLPADKFMKKVADPDWLALIASPVARQIADVEQRLAS
ncbi:MAG TPA: EAL domain-containing protein [Caulobacteraceae bacterium]|nr:EAL domain-containing protein [Caulobacteraceae bacterium]